MDRFDIPKKILIIVATSFLNFCIIFLPALTIANTALKINPEDAKPFGIAIGLVKELYVNPVEDNTLFSHAIEGMLAGLDPHSSYLDEESFAMLKNHTQGQFSGIGIEVTTEKGLIKVISPLDDTPAQKAGIKSGDYIIAVNGAPLMDTPIMEALKQIKGKPGSSVSLTVIGKTDKKPRTVEVKREVIQVKSVKAKLLPGDFGYIRISHFEEETPEKLIEAVHQLQSETHHNLKGLILDLRNNPGGLMIAAIKIADDFLDAQKLGNNKKIVFTKGRVKKTHTSAYAHKGDILFGAPIVILINQGSASASEIVAGALQDHQRALIVGQRSFGKGSVQTVFPLSDKTAIKLTTALYYTPKGRSIQAEGIEPDILVDQLSLNSKKKDEALFFWKIHEYNLNGHLKNSNGKKQQKQKEQLDLHTIAESDYQLYEALQILKSQHILKAQSKK